MGLLTGNPLASPTTQRTGYFNPPASGSVVGASNPPATGGSDQTDPLNGPGSIDFNLLDPQGSADKAKQESTDLWDGFKTFMFGTTEPDAKGNHGGILGVGNVPFVGDALRAATDVVGLPVHALGGIASAIGDAAERIPNPTMPEEARQSIISQFNALPDDSPEKQAALKQIEGDQGLLGTGLLDSHLTAMTKALQAYEVAQPKSSLWTGTFRPAASLADSFADFFGALGAPVRLVERNVAGAARPGADNLNQLQQIMAVGSGQARWTSDDAGLTPVEKMAYDMKSSGQWTDAQALDFLSSHGAGFSHNKALEIASNIFLDPLTVGAGGAGALSKLGKVGLALVNIQRDASAALAAEKALGAAADAQKVASLEIAVETAKNGIKAGVAGDQVASRNILGQLAKQKWTGDLARGYGHVYGALDGTTIGRVAKATRTMIDPLHAWGERPRTMAALDEGSQDVTRAVVSAHGEFTNIELGHHLREMPGVGEDMLREYEDGLSIYSANTLRRVAGRRYRAVQMLMDKADALIDSPPFASIKDIMQATKRSALTQLEQEAGKFVRRKGWTDADKANLADRLATLWGGMSKDKWVTELAKPRWSGEKLSLLHSSTYGSAVRQLHDAREAMQASGQAGVFADRLHQLVLLNKQTLTDLGAEGILKRLAEQPMTDAKLAIIADAKAQYPELRNFIDDPTSASKTVEAFTDMVERRKNFLPAQIRNEERAGLAGPLADFDERTRNIFTIGFRPKDEFLWGLEPGTDGVLREVGDPWFDQVSSNLRGYMPVHELAFNIAGRPLPIIGKAARMLDAAEAAGRIAMHGVTGTMVETAAHSRFVENVLAEYEHAGLSKSQAEGIWQALMKKVDDSENISGIRGLSRDAIWNGAKAVIPAYAERAGLDRRALLMHVLEAYDGDLRYIGLTQKFTGRAKTLAAALTGANTAGQIAEHVWPLLKFRINAFFQLQEKIEPWVLNAQRGASIAIGRKMTESDRLTAGLYRNFVDKNLINMSDNDISELARKMGWGKGMETASRAEGGKMAYLRGKIEALTEVQGVKQLNMLRTFRKGLGREMRAVWEQNLPGEWDKMLRNARALAGANIDEDEFAARLAAENLDANNVLVKRITDSMGNFGGWEAEFSNAIKVGQWSAPQSLGELRPLELDHLVTRLGLRDSLGRDIETQQQMREALASQRITNDDIMRGLRDLGAHPDYAARVESAFHFSYRDFWKNAQTAFSLSDEERLRMEAMFRSIAQGRDMTPVEYLSQVYSPVIVAKGEAALGSLGNLVDFMRNGLTQQVPDLAHLVGEAGQATADDLYRQMGAIMAHHLDPSAKRAFLLEMHPELRAAATRGEILTDLRDIQEMWDSNATDALSDRITQFVMGRPGDGAHAFVTDPASGVARIRDLATELRAAAGRPRNLQRVVYEDNEALAQEAARFYDDTPETFEQVATPDELSQRVDPASVERVMRASGTGMTSGPTAFKAEFKALPKSLQSAYEAYAMESRALYRHLTDTLHLDIKATQRAPATAEAIRAQLGRGVLRLPDKGYWHPVYNTEDLFIQRAVRDAFGYGQEATPLGSHDSLFSAAALYSDEARSVMLSDEFARKAWEAHSTRIIDPAVESPSTVAEYEATFGAAAHGPQEMASGIGNSIVLRATRQTRSVGSGVRALDPEAQHELLSTVSAIRREFPDVPLPAIDVARLPEATQAATLGYESADPTIVFNPRMWGPDRLENRAAREMNANLGPTATTFNGQQRVTPLGVRYSASDTAVGDVYHEMGHVVESHLINKGTDGEYRYEPLNELMHRFNEDAVAKQTLSEYAFKEDAEAFAELFDLSFNPEHIDRALTPELAAYRDAFREDLRKAKVWVPGGQPLVQNPMAGKTVAEANAAGAAIRAPFRPARLPQDMLDRLTQHYLGSGRFAESNPDVARMAAYLRDHMQTMTAHALRYDAASGLGHIFTAMSGMPVSAGVPFNLTEARLWDAAAQSMASKWQDAFRLQYFAQNRSMFQRSLNHPMFGMYPASYMWGKIGPELIKFMALEPFGMNTGALGYSLANMQKAVAVQRQYDPEFEKWIDGVGANPALSFLGYLLPATPWSVPSSYPAWMRDMAQQGMAQEDTAKGGGIIDGDNFITPLQAVVKRSVPYSTTLPWFGRALGSLGQADTTPLTTPAGTKDAMGNIVAPPPPPAPNLTEPVQGSALPGVLLYEMRDLQGLLGS